MNADERREYYSKETIHRVPESWEKPIDSFECRTCGRLVEIFDRFDKRTVYCSRACEKKYWRDATRHKNRTGNLIKRERRDLL